MKAQEVRHRGGFRPACCDARHARDPIVGISRTPILQDVLGFSLQDLGLGFRGAGLYANHESTPA